MSQDLPRTVHQMASYAAYHLSSAATGGREMTEEQVAANLRKLYKRADEEDIAAAMHYGRESAAASAAFPQAVEGQSLSDVANVPPEAEVTIYFRLRWGEGEDAEYKMFPVRVLGGTELSLAKAAAVEMAAAMAAEEDYPTGVPDEVVLFKVDFFND